MFKDRRVFLLLVSLLLVSWAVVGCGSLPTSFVVTNATELQYITWQAQNGGQVTGSLFDNSYAQFAGNAISSSSLALTGNQQKNQVNLVLSGLLGGFTLTGTIQGNTLTLTEPDSSGHLGNTIWYAATQDQYNQLLTAFTGYMQVKSAQANLDSQLQNARSFPPTQGADQAVSLEQTAIAQFQKDFSALTSCDGYFGVALDADEANGSFDLSRDMPEVGDLMQALSALNSAWNQAKGAKLPDIQGLVLPWVVQASAITGETTAVQQFISQTQADYQHDQQLMVGLQQHDQQLNQQLQQFKQAHSC